MKEHNTIMFYGRGFGLASKQAYEHALRVVQMVGDLDKEIKVIIDIRCTELEDLKNRVKALEKKGSYPIEILDEMVEYK
jgi:hypothetical protein